MQCRYSKTHNCSTKQQGKSLINKLLRNFKPHNVSSEVQFWLVWGVFTPTLFGSDDTKKVPGAKLFSWCEYKPANKQLFWDLHRDKSQFASKRTTVRVSWCVKAAAPWFVTVANCTLFTRKRFHSHRHYGKYCFSKHDRKFSSTLSPDRQANMSRSHSSSS